jgi:hypothetical protein
MVLGIAVHEGMTRKLKWCPTATDIRENGTQTWEKILTCISRKRRDSTTGVIGGPYRKWESAYIFYSTP